MSGDEPKIRFGSCQGRGGGPCTARHANGATKPCATWNFPTCKTPSLHLQPHTDTNTHTAHRATCLKFILIGFELCGAVFLGGFVKPAPTFNLGRGTHGFVVRTRGSRNTWPAGNSSQTRPLSLGWWSISSAPRPAPARPSKTVPPLPPPLPLQARPGCHWMKPSTDLSALASE